MTLAVPYSDNAMLAALYARISEDRAGTEAGVKRQLDDGRDLVARRGGVVAGEYVDNDISAKNGRHRPRYEELMTLVDTGKISHIVVFHTSRLWRNRGERAAGIERLRKAGVSVAVIKGTDLDLASASGRMIAGILGEFDTGESEIKSERVEREVYERAKNGLNHGGRRPYGYTSNGMEVVEDEKGEVAEMARKLLAGIPLAAIVRDLNARGVRTVTGCQWSSGSVRDVLKRARNAGLSVHRGEILGEAQWPAVMPEQTWRAVSALLADPARRTSTGNRASYLLSGIAVCGLCEGSITSKGVKQSSVAHGATMRWLYGCRGCARVARRRDWCDQYVTARIIARLNRPDAHELLQDHTRLNFEALAAEARSWRIQMEEAAADRAEDLITREQLHVITAKARSRLAAIDDAQRSTSRAPVLVDLIQAKDKMDYWQNSMVLDRQRAVVKVLADVTLLPGGGGSRLFDPTKVKVEFRAP
jgi:DNA invertase Pin-like site-specific DNA recombinase